MQFKMIHESANPLKLIASSRRSMSNQREPPRLRYAGARRAATGKPAGARAFLGRYPDAAAATGAWGFIQSQFPAPTRGASASTQASGDGGTLLHAALPTREQADVLYAGILARGYPCSVQAP
jgi:hypothetical protein